MTKEELIYPLKKIELIKSKYDILREKEEKFNIFSVLHKDHDEVRLHSRFIAALLDPHASHSMDKTFLYHFLDLLQKNLKRNSKEKKLKDDFQNPTVYPEEWNKKEHENIDILIIDKQSKHAVIIENKIHAVDSNNKKGGQLERYFNHVLINERIPKENILLYYLTLDGHKPSKESLGDYKTLENINGQCLSYHQIVLDWIELCLPHAVDKPFLREAIFQYKKLIKKMTHDDTILQERKWIKDIIGSNEENM